MTACLLPVLASLPFKTKPIAQFNHIADASIALSRIWNLNIPEADDDGINGIPRESHRQRAVKPHCWFA